MKHAKTRIVAALIALALTATAAFGVAAQQPAAARPAHRPLVQLTVLLDTSGSMGGLIEQAKTQLWSIVNEFATAKQNGMTIELQVALYEYGNDGLPAEKKWIRQIVPLTTDLDEVSKQLFALTTNGGQEYCGAVIDQATRELKWSEAATDMKAIFIAGNEEFTQGPVDYTKACKAAIEKGIIVNTIHCGSNADGISGKWADGAALADGKYMCIDHNRQIVQIDAPQDKKIAELGVKLNETYVAFGAQGQQMAERQQAQDANAAGQSTGSNVSRMVAKAGAQYRNASWDLVDAIREGNVKIEDVKVEDLPESMQKMTLEQRKAYVEGQQKARLDLQKQIQQLNEERVKFVAAKQKELAEKTGKESLDQAMLRAAHEQAAKLNIEMK
jgi:hypothetical protein